MTTIEQDSELFSGAAYTVPFPKADGHEVSRLLLRLGGTLELDRNNEEHAKLIESLTLGRMVAFTITASVDGKTQAIRYDSDENEVVTHAVSLKLHTVEEA